MAWPFSELQARKIGSINLQLPQFIFAESINRSDGARLEGRNSSTFELGFTSGSDKVPNWHFDFALGNSLKNYDFIYVDSSTGGTFRIPLVTSLFTIRMGLAYVWSSQPSVERPSHNVQAGIGIIYGGGSIRSTTAGSFDNLSQENLQDVSGVEDKGESFLLPILTRGSYFRIAYFYSFAKDKEPTPFHIGWNLTFERHVGPVRFLNSVNLGLLLGTKY